MRHHFTVSARRPSPNGGPTIGTMIWVEQCESVTDELVEAMERLIPQLSSSSPPPTAAELTEIVESEATHLLVARDGDGPGLGGEVVGSMTLVVFRIPTGVRAWIEDVVVDAAARGQGVGEALNRSALEVAERRGARTVDLTSRPSREAANRLYRRLGFVERETNVYRYERRG
jgi:ribosomal protein S18 acetylase RimI-like enzyme